MSKSEFPLGFVVYKPDLSSVARISDVLDAGYEVYLFDNSPQCPEIRTRFLNRPNLHYSTVGSNVGLGYGISAVCAEAYYRGSEWLLFLDQDTVYTARTLDYINTYVRKQREALAAYSGATFCQDRCLAWNPDMPPERVLLTINSGTIYRLEVLSKIGWMNVDYFVDCVDYEYCLRSLNARFHVGRCWNTPELDHRRDQGNTDVFLFGKTRQLRRYPLGRIRGTVKSSMKLIVASAISMQLRFCLAISRSLVGYIFWQIVSRVLVQRSANTPHLSA